MEPDITVDNHPSPAIYIGLHVQRPGMLHDLNVSRLTQRTVVCKRGNSVPVVTVKPGTRTQCVKHTSRPLTLLERDTFGALLKQMHRLREEIRTCL